ncbi:hemolysin [Chelativorans sp. AA-79]|uniref:hemolysin n=1 Tax=Chelativorans sp. AA-79 TaxID=3028735 RepID=UPI0023F83E5F|nr:hemolysin [Chelativorans sp. AA-79]WEX08519.1 hemolysin [Chelativorans sp. AA-79]
MVATIQLTSASSDWVDYLTNDWLSGFNNPTYGDFYQNYNPGDPNKVYTQWGAGTSTGSGVVLDGSFTYNQGDLDGTIDTLTFGDGLTGSGSTGFGVSNPELTIDLGGANAITSFDYSIYNISVNGSFTGTGSTDGLFDYFDDVGTAQIGTSANDVFTGFASDDTFVFDDGWGDDEVNNFGTTSGNEDVLDLTDVSGITSYMDLIFNHSNWSDATGVLTISDGGNEIQVNGYVGSDIFAFVNDGNVLV